jgi:hypothetical protein
MDVYIILVILLLVLAFADLVVGVSNDAVNFLNSAIGSQVASRRNIMIIASFGILIGALFAGGMMEVARKGIFNPQMFNFHEVMIIFLAVMFADIILLDIFNTLGLPTSTTVSIVFELLGAAIHAGWRGTANAIVQKTLDKMIMHFHTHPSDCFAYVGTCISQPFFEVDEDVALYFDQEFYVFDKEKNKYFIDLKGCNVRALSDAGLMKNHISVSPFCTVKDNDLFFSHRHEKGTTGRFGVIIGMKA